MPNATVSGLKGKLELGDWAEGDTVEHTPARDFNCDKGRWSKLFRGWDPTVVVSVPKTSRSHETVNAKAVLSTSGILSRARTSHNRTPLREGVHSVHLPKGKVRAAHSHKPFLAPLVGEFFDLCSVSPVSYIYYVCYRCTLNRPFDSQTGLCFSFH